MSRLFRKKPVVIEAITFDEFVQHGRDSGAAIVNGMPWSFSYKGHGVTHENDQCYLIPTLEGPHNFTPEDMLITGVNGEIYPCNKDIFAATYNAADVVAVASPEVESGGPSLVENMVQRSFGPANEALRGAMGIVESEPPMAEPGTVGGESERRGRLAYEAFHTARGCKVGSTWDHGGHSQRLEWIAAANAVVCDVISQLAANETKCAGSTFKIPLDPHPTPTAAAISRVKRWRRDLDAILQEMKDAQDNDRVTGSSDECNARMEAVLRLTESIMWCGMILKAIGTPNPYPESKDPSSQVVAPTADGLKM